MGALQRRLSLPAAVHDALTVSLDVDVELAVGARWRLRARSGGPGVRTSGVMALGESVQWAMRVWGVVPVRHTSRIVALVQDDGRGGASFVDEMTAGVLAAYRHEHSFLPIDGDMPMGTEMVDDVQWRSPGGPLGALGTGCSYVACSAGCSTTATPRSSGVCPRWLAARGNREQAELSPCRGSRERGYGWFAVGGRSKVAASTAATRRPW